MPIRTKIRLKPRRRVEPVRSAPRAEENTAVVIQDPNHMAAINRGMAQMDLGLRESHQASLINSLACTAITVAANVETPASARAADAIFDEIRSRVGILSSLRDAVGIRERH